MTDIEFTNIYNKDGNNNKAMKEKIEQIIDRNTEGNYLHDWEMFKVFAKLHPIEAYDLRPDDFCKFMRGEGYDLNNEQIKELVDSSRLGCR